MNKLFLSFSALLCLVHGQSIAQKPGDVRWSLSTEPSPGADTIHCIKVQPDGKIVAAGNSYKGAFMAICIGRSEAGIPDTSFGMNGMVTTSLDSAHTVANAVEILPDGKIVVAGGYKKGRDGDFVLARYNPDGRVDSSFGIDGIVRADIGSGSFDIATASAIQTDGKILVAGRTDTSLALCRFTASGSLDTGFDSDGKLTIAAGGATCMKLQTDGKIVVGCGRAVVRLMPDGSLDYSFGTNGVAALVHYTLGMAIQNDGKILLSGDGGGEFVLQRLDTTGVIDHRFGNGGIVKTTGFTTNSFPSYPRCATSVSLQADGRILAGGWAQTTMQVSKHFAVARYHTNGSPDSSFGKYGKVLGLLGAKSYTAAINNNSEIVVAGTNETSIQGGYYGWAIEGYYLGPMLAVQAVPGANGKMTVAPNPAEEFARVQSTHIDNGTWRLSVCDLTGRTLSSETIVVTNNAFDKSISLIGLPAAMYLVGLENGVSRMAVMLTKSR